MRAKKKATENPWLGAFLGLVFFTAGLLAFSFTAGTMLVGYWSSTNWVEVPANILQLSLDEHRDSDSTTYRVEGRYSYRFRDEQYNSDQISISKSRDNVGSYWQNLYQDLTAAKNNNETFAYINPDKPQEAYLDRTFRWNQLLFGSLFLVLFSGVGGGIIWASFRKPGQHSADKQNAAELGVKSNQLFGSKVMAAVGGLFFLMGSAMSILVLPSALGKGEYMALFVLVFVIIGAGILYVAWRNWHAYWRFGPTPLFLDPLYPVVGGELGGSFDLRVAKLTGATNPLIARLTCKEVKQTGDRKSHVTKWQQETAVTIKPTATGLRGSFLFDIPEQCEPSGRFNKFTSIRWDLVVSGDYQPQGMGRFKRSWNIVVADQPSRSSD